MKKTISILVLIIIGVCFLIKSRSFERINSDEVSKITIIKGNQQVIKNMTCDNDKTEINNIISIYNESKRYYAKGDTTTSHSIVITLKDGKIVEVQGNTQHYQYVYKNGKHYKISNPELTTFFREIDIYDN